MLIARRNIVDHRAPQQMTSLRTVAARWSLRLENDWADVSHCEARSSLVSDMFGHHDDKSRQKLDRGTRTGIVPTEAPAQCVTEPKERISIGEEGHLGPPETGNDMQEQTFQRNQLAGRSQLTTTDLPTSSQAVVLIKLGYVKSRPEVSPNRSSTKTSQCQ
ncbi:hypothetical protein [Bradyrhizobium iriomotense]|uniref:hypothetical protein n=1 Tax=Bradyrhizobium iriomotense TaxID=441950 RepID=UPI0024E061F4|nr:hypothetical protein [Bradyrhizobium iriomotense]